MPVCLMFPQQSKGYTVMSEVYGSHLDKVNASLFH